MSMKTLVGALLIGGLIAGCSNPFEGIECESQPGAVTYHVEMTHRPGSTCAFDESHIHEQVWEDGKYVYDPACKAGGQRRNDHCWWKVRVECPEWSWEQTTNWSDDYSSGVGVIEYVSDKCQSTIDIVLTRQ